MIASLGIILICILKAEGYIKTIENPDHVDKKSDAPKIITSKAMDKFHVLRVVFKVVDGIITVITFYPAKRGRYYEDN